MRRATLLLVAALPSVACVDNPGTRRSTAISPDNAFTAIQTLDDRGGATVAFYTDVDVRPAPEAKQPYSEVSVLHIKGDDWVGMEWTGPRTLKLTVPSSAKIERFRPKVDDLQIVLVREGQPDA